MAVKSSIHLHTNTANRHTEASKNLHLRLHYQITIQRYATRIPTCTRKSSPDYTQCYLCPGNKRAQGDTNPKYVEPFIFVNDYSAVKEVQAEYKPEASKGIVVPLLFLETH
jgi:hypothetical protein